jgi:MFS family permease
MYSLVGSLSVAVALLCAPLANVLTKRFGHRMPMLGGKHTIESTLFLFTSLIILGMLACSLGQCMAGLCTTFNTFIVCQGFVFGVGKQSCIRNCQTRLSANTARSRTGTQQQHGYISLTYANYDSYLIQTLVPSQPLLAHWFDRKLSLAQVSYSSHLFVLTQAHDNVPGTCQCRLGSGRSHLIKHHSTTHRPLVSKILSDHQWCHLGWCPDTLHTGHEA